MLTLYLAYLDDETDKEFFEKMYSSYRKQNVYGCNVYIT